MNKVCLAVVVLCLVQALAFRVRVGRPSRPSFTLKMSDAAEDFSKYAVGQEVKGKVVSSKAFGVFVELEGTKTRALLPRSLLSRGAYEKLTLLATTKSSETIACELASVSAENKTLSATWGAPTMDVTTILKEDYKTKKFPATVVGTHDFGVFVELDG